MKLSKPTWKIINKTCLAILEDYPANTFKAVVTSPPYKNKDGYSKALMLKLAKILLTATQRGGLSFINFASLAEEWGRPFEVYNFFIEAGWLPVTTIAWTKSMVVPPPSGVLGQSLKEAIAYLKRERDIYEELGPRELKKFEKTIANLELLLEPRQIGHYTPIEAETRMNNLWEYIHVFSKETLPVLDRLTAPNGVTYSDKSNLARGNRGKNGDRHCSGNVWYIPYKTTGGSQKKPHSYTYPDELVERCLRLANIKSGDAVLDPFAGGGTTISVAKRMGISAVGYELNPEIASRTAKAIESTPGNA